MRPFALRVEVRDATTVRCFLGNVVMYSPAPTSVRSSLLPDAGRADRKRATNSSGGMVVPVERCSIAGQLCHRIVDGLDEFVRRFAHLPSKHQVPPQQLESPDPLRSFSPRKLAA